MPSPSIDKPIADLQILLVICNGQGIRKLDKTDLTDGQPCLIDEHLLIVFTRIGMIEMSMEPGPEYICDLFGEVTPSLLGFRFPILGVSNI